MHVTHTWSGPSEPHFGTGAGTVNRPMGNGERGSQRGWRIEDGRWWRRRNAEVEVRHGESVRWRIGGRRAGTCKGNKTVSARAPKRAREARALPGLRDDAA